MINAADYDKVDLGCGESKNNGALGVDVVNTDETDMIQDLDEFPWDLPDDNFKTIYCKDILEHVESPLKFLEEVHRIGVDGAYVYIRTPHFTNNNAWVDPTHKRPFSALMFDDYITSEGKYSYYTDATFELEYLNIGFPMSVLLPWNFFARYIANSATWFYEKTVLRSLFPAGSMEVELKIVK